MGPRLRGAAKAVSSVVASAALIHAAVWSATVLAAEPEPLQPPPVLTLLTFQPGSLEDLCQTLDAVWETPRPPGTIPNVAPEFFPAGMSSLPVEVKKRTFLRALAPHVVAANLWIAYERDYLVETLACKCDPQELGPAHRACLRGLAKRYRVPITEEGAPFTPQTIGQLRRRVDVVPVGLALAQAAIESGWGASRFARLANNLFGQWVFSADKGIAPERRPKGANYAVARFEHLGQSVGAYLFNLNTFSAYRELRELRQTMREMGGGLDSGRLAAGLRRYSERREAYVDDVRLVLRANALDAFDAAVFTRWDLRDWAEHLADRGRIPDLSPALLIAPFEDPTRDWGRWEAKRSQTRIPDG